MTATAGASHQRACGACWFLALLTCVVLNSAHPDRPALRSVLAGLSYRATRTASALVLTGDGQRGEGCFNWTAHLGQPGDSRFALVVWRYPIAEACENPSEATPMAWLLVCPVGKAPPVPSEGSCPLAPPRPRERGGGVKSDGSWHALACLGSRWWFRVFCSHERAISSQLRLRCRACG